MESFRRIRLMLLSVIFLAIPFVHGAAIQLVRHDNETLNVLDKRQAPGTCWSCLGGRTARHYYNLVNAEEDDIRAWIGRVGNPEAPVPPAIDHNLPRDGRTLTSLFFPAPNSPNDHARGRWALYVPPLLQRLQVYLDISDEEMMQAAHDHETGFHVAVRSIHVRYQLDLYRLPNERHRRPFRFEPLNIAVQAGNHHAMPFDSDGRAWFTWYRPGYNNGTSRYGIHENSIPLTFRAEDFVPPDFNRVQVRYWVDFLYG